MNPTAPPFEPQGFEDTEEPLRDVQTANDARAARLAAFYSDTESDDTCDSDGDAIWKPAVWDPKPPESVAEQPSVQSWGDAGWDSSHNREPATEPGAWGKGVGSPQCSKLDLTPLGWSTKSPSARILGYASDAVEPGLRPPLSVERCWEELDSPERAAAVALLGSTEDSWNADHSAASGERVAQRLDAVRMQIGLSLQPAWWEAMDESDGSGNPATPTRVRRVRIGEEGQTPREVREIEMTPLSVRRQQMWRPNWKHSESESESESDDDEDDDDDDDDDTSDSATDTTHGEAAETSVTEQQQSRAESAVSAAAADGVDPDAPVRPGRLRSYEHGEYQHARELSARKHGQRREKKPTDIDADRDDFPLSPPGWKDLATAEWERKNMHKQKYRAARAATKQEAAGIGPDKINESAVGRWTKSHSHGVAKGRRSPGGNSRRDSRNGRRHSTSRELQDQTQQNDRSDKGVLGQEHDGDGEKRKGDEPAGSGSAADGEELAPDDGELDAVQAQIAELKAELNIA